MRTLAPSGVRLVNQVFDGGWSPRSSVAKLAAAHAEGHRADRVSVFLPSVAAEEADGSASRSHGVEYRILASVVSIASLPKKRPSSARALGAPHLRGAEPLQPAPEHTGEHHAARIRSYPARRISGVAPGVARGEHSRHPWHTLTRLPKPRATRQAG